MNRQRNWGSYQNPAFVKDATDSFENDSYSNEPANAQNTSGFTYEGGPVRTENNYSEFSNQGTSLEHLSRSADSYDYTSNPKRDTSHVYDDHDWSSPYEVLGHVLDPNYGPNYHHNYDNSDVQNRTENYVEGRYASESNYENHRPNTAAEYSYAQDQHLHNRNDSRRRYNSSEINTSRTPASKQNGYEDYEEENFSQSSQRMKSKVAWPEKSVGARTFYTMKHAKDIAAQLALENRDYELDTIENEVIPEHGRNVKRRCWGRSCWSLRFHSHAVRSNGTRTRLQQTPVSPATGFSALELNKQKARKRLTETWKDITGRLFIWSQSMKTIEGRYGTGVVSYFIFLRWLLLLTVFMCALVLSFVVIPQSIAKYASEEDSLIKTNNVSVFNSSAFFYERNNGLHVSPMELKQLPHVASETTTGLFETTTLRNDDEIYDESRCLELYKIAVDNKTQTGIKGVQDFLQGTGFMEYTPLFPGWYSPNVTSVFQGSKPYNVSLAYVFVTLTYFLVCLVMMVIYTSEGVHETLKTSEGQLHKYCNLVFGGWDYCIEQRKTANRKHQSISQELKSTLFEKRRKNEVENWSRKTKFIVFTTRCALNLIVFAFLIAGGWTIYIVCDEKLISNVKKNHSDDFVLLLMEFLPSITITLLNMVLPIVFKQIANLERYSVAFTIKITLIRTVFVRLASIGVLVWTFYMQFNCPNRDKHCQHCVTKNENFVTRCWETYVGQQLYKLVILDFVVVLVTTILIDFPRRLIFTKCSCKLAKIFGPLEFDIPKHVLDLVYSQTLCWLGTFYSPLLPAICVIKYIIFFYLKKWTLLVNCSPSQIPYRASKSNSFFMIVLMLSFVLSAIPVAYTIAKIPPSRGCGPFRGNDYNMWNPVAQAVESSNNPPLQYALKYLASAGFAVPLFVVLCLLIYYYLTVSSAHKEMINVLKDQLVLEGKDKQFLLARLTEDAKQRHRMGNPIS